jgi:hypothetical protein
MNILRRRGIENPSDHLVSPVGKRLRAPESEIFRAADEVEAGFATLRYL